MDCDHVGVVKARRSSCLKEKSLQSFLIFSQRSGKQFDGHIPLELGVVSQPYFAHHPHAELALDDVVPNGACHASRVTQRS
jgi:hypothetical protein